MIGLKLSEITSINIIALFQAANLAIFSQLLEFIRKNFILK
jgi:hypothetical protein